MPLLRAAVDISGNRQIDSWLREGPWHATKRIFSEPLETIIQKYYTISWNAREEIVKAKLSIIDEIWKKKKIKKKTFLFPALIQYPPYAVVLEFLFTRKEIIRGEETILRPLKERRTEFWNARLRMKKVENLIKNKNKAGRANNSISKPRKKRPGADRESLK